MKARETLPTRSSQVTGALVLSLDGKFSRNHDPRQMRNETKRWNPRETKWKSVMGTSEAQTRKWEREPMTIREMRNGECTVYACVRATAKVSSSFVILRIQFSPLEPAKASY